MNVKTTVTLLVLLILCLALVVLVRSDWLASEDGEEKDQAANALLPEMGKLVRLTLQTGEGGKIVLEKRDDKWRLLEPVDAPATRWRTQSAADTFTGLAFIRKHAPDDEDFPKDDLTRLSEPLGVVTLADDKDATYTINVGRNLPGSKRTYVQLAGDEHVYVVDANLLETLERDVADYRDTRVIDFDTADAVRVEVRGDRNFRLVKIKDKWVLDSPVSAPADAGAVSSLLSAISGIRAEKFVDDAPTDLLAHGLHARAMRVTVELAPPEPAATQPTTRPAAPKKGRVITITFGTAAETGKTVFAKLADKPWVFQVSESKVKDLQPKIIDLRDKHVLSLGSQEVSRIEVDLKAGTSADLEKVDDVWHMRSPFAGRCDQGSVDKLLNTLRDLEASQFEDNPISLVDYGLTPPVGKIVLHFRGSDQTTTLLLGRASSAHVGFVQPANSKTVAVVQASDYGVLLRPAPAYWEKTVFELPEDAEVTRVDLTRGIRTFTIEKQPEGEFKLLRPVAAAADADNVKALLDAVKTIRADKITSLGKAVPARFTKARPIKLTLTYKQPIPAPPETKPAATAPATKPATQPVPRAVKKSPVLLVAEDKGKSYVWQEAAKPVAVGELDKSLHEAVAAELRDREVLEIDAAKAVSLKMDLDKLSMEFSRAGDVWRYAQDRFIKIDATKVKQFLDQLAAIKAERFVHYGDKPELKRYGLDKPAMTILVKTEAGKSIRLAISRTGPVATRGHYATSSEVPGVFVLTPSAKTRMTMSLKDFQTPKAD